MNAATALDVDGLSHNPDKCDTGCIGANPD